MLISQLRTPPTPGTHYRLSDRYGGGTITVRLLGTPADADRKLNRTAGSTTASGSAGPTGSAAPASTSTFSATPSWSTASRSTDTRSADQPSPPDGQRERKAHSRRLRRACPSGRTAAETASSPDQPAVHRHWRRVLSQVFTIPRPRGAWAKPRTIWWGTVAGSALGTDCAGSGTR